MRLPVTLSLALIAVGPLRAEAPSIEGTLPEDYMPELKPLLQTAVERSPSTISSSIAILQAEASRLSAYSILYPSLNLGSDYSKNREATSTSQVSTSSGLFYNLGINQPIFQWGAYKNNALIGKLGLKIAERQYADAYRMLASAIREQYMGLIGKKIVMRNAIFNQKLADVEVQAAQAKFESGASSQADLQTFQLALEQTKLDCDRAVADFANTKRIFTRLVGIDDIPDDSIPMMVPHPEYSAPKADAILAGFVGEGIESTYQSQVYQLQIKQQDLNYQIQRVRLLPKVGASAGYSYENYTAASVGSVSQVGISAENVTLAASWNIFDGFATRAGKLSALEAKRSFERQKKSYVDSTIDTITYMRHQIEFSSRALSLSEIHHALIDAEVKRLSGEKIVGYASQASIDVGLQTLYATEFQMSEARTDLLSRWTDFISLAGIDPALSNIPSSYVR